VRLKDMSKDDNNSTGSNESYLMKSSWKLESILKVKKRENGDCSTFDRSTAGLLSRKGSGSFFQKYTSSFVLERFSGISPIKFEQLHTPRPLDILTSFHIIKTITFSTLWICYNKVVS